MFVQAFNNNNCLISTGPRGCRAQLSKNRQGPHFNGFCFSVNVEKIKQAAFEDNIFLFDPSEVIVGQEDSLAKRMKASGLSPIIIHCAFVYHFKSVTVSSANFETFKQKVQKHNITVHRLGKTAMTELVFYDASQQKTIRKRFDIREDLRWYHADFDDEFLIKRIFEEDTNESSNVLDLLKSASKDHVIDSCQHGVNATTLFPLYSFSDWKQQSTKTTTVLRAIWRDLSLNLKQSSPCMYPSLWDEKCLEMIIPSSQDSPKYMDMQIFGRVPTKGKLVIAFVVPGTTFLPPSLT